MRYIFAISILLASVYCKSQTSQKLVYPVVPIADECHKALDNSDSIIVMSRADFLQLDSLWTTLNTCYNYTADTLWIKQFEIAFGGIMNDGKASFLVQDGNLKNEYLSSLLDARKNIKSYDHIHIKNMQYEQYGGMYQVADIHIAIDSLVVPELDTCWRYFPVAPSGPRANIHISKNQLTALLRDSMGYDRCSKTKRWPNDSLKVHMWYNAPRSLMEHYTINVFTNDFELTDTTNMEPIIARLNNLDYGDVVAFRRSVYVSGNSYRYTPEYRFTITDRKPCSSTFDLQSADSTALYSLIDSIRNGMLDSDFCIVNSSGHPITFRVVTVPQEGAAAILSVSNGRLNKSVISHIQKLKTGDKILLEKPFSYELHSNKTLDYESRIIFVK